VRWPRSMPQYEVGHLERVRAIETTLPAGIFVTGNALHGVGVADAVRSAGETAERVRAYLADANGLTDPEGNGSAASRSENVGGARPSTRCTSAARPRVGSGTSTWTTRRRGSRT